MLTYSMDNRNNVSKTLFLYRCIRKDIESGTIKKGEKLPSKRSLAEHLSISVITVENAYSLLQDEGYIESRPKSGFYVSSQIKVNRNPGNPYSLLDEKEDTITGDAVLPSMAKIMRKVISEMPEITGIKPPTMGCACVRNEIATFLKRYRNMNVNPRNIVIGSGAEYLYSLIVYLFGIKRTYAIENPSYEKIYSVYKLNGAKVELLYLEKDGIPTSELNRTKATILHVSPFHSYPSGITASAGKRHEYVDWAMENSGYLIEDDFDSEFVYSKKPLETLYSIDKNERVIYLNTFSKSISPSIRIGYMILPDELEKEYEKKLSFLSCTVPVFDQYVLAEYIRSGSFERLLNIRRKSSHGN